MSPKREACITKLERFALPPNIKLQKQSITYAVSSAYGKHAYNLGTFGADVNPPLVNDGRLIRG